MGHRVDPSIKSAQKAFSATTALLGHLRFRLPSKRGLLIEKREKKKTAHSVSAGRNLSSATDLLFFFFLDNTSFIQKVTAGCKRQKKTTTTTKKKKKRTCLLLPQHNNPSQFLFFFYIVVASEKLKANAVVPALIHYSALCPVNHMKQLAIVSVCKTHFLFSAYAPHFSLPGKQQQQHISLVSKPQYHQKQIMTTTSYTYSITSHTLDRIELQRCVLPVSEQRLGEVDIDGFLCLFGAKAASQLPDV